MTKKDIIRIYRDDKGIHCKCADPNEAALAGAALILEELYHGEHVRLNILFQTTVNVLSAEKEGRLEARYIDKLRAQIVEQRKIWEQ